MRRVVDVQTIPPSTFDFRGAWKGDGNVGNIKLDGGWSAWVVKYNGGTLIYIPGVTPPTVKIWDLRGDEPASLAPDTSRGERRPQLDEGDD